MKVGGEAVGDEGVVASSEAALQRRGQPTVAGGTGGVAGVDLHQQPGEPRHPSGLGGHLGHGGEIAQEVRRAQAVFGLLELPVQRQAVMDDHPR